MPKQLPLALLLLRLGVFIVFLFWTLDKLVQPDHAAKVFGAFYGLDGLGETAFYLIGAAQLVLILAFVAGFSKPGPMAPFWSFTAFLPCRLSANTFSLLTTSCSLLPGRCSPPAPLYSSCGNPIP